jgi:hypothetical protein
MGMADEDAKTAGGIDALEPAVGRLAVCLLVPVCLVDGVAERVEDAAADEAEAPDAEGPRWVEGPLPLEFTDDRQQLTPANTAARRTYFDDRAARVLYGKRRRWHLPDVTAEPLVAGLSVTAVERWQFASVEQSEQADQPEQPDQSDQPDQRDPAAILVLHLDLGDEHQLEALNDIVRFKHPSADLRGWVRTAGLGATVPDSVGRAFAITFATPSASPWPEVSERLTARGWTPLEQWTWFLASVTPSHRFVPAGTDVEAVGEVFALSDDWSARAIRDGVAFVADRPYRGRPKGSRRDFLYDAEVYVRTLYVDTFLLAMAQQLELRRLANLLAGIEDPADDPEGLLDLERETSRFRNTYWWQHLTQHGTANTLLRSFQAQHRLPELLDQVTAELRDYGRQSQLRARRRSEAAAHTTNLLLLLLALLGVPLASVQMAMIVADRGVEGVLIALLVLTVLIVVADILLMAFPRARSALRALLRSPNS